MTEEKQDVNASEPSAEEVQDVNLEESSTTELEEATSQEAVQEVAEETEEVEEIQQVPYDRFKEVNEEITRLQDLVQTLAQRQNQGETPKEVESDPYAGMTPEEVAFYRNSDMRTKKLIQEEAKKLSAPLVQQNQAIAKKLSMIMEKDFRKSNEDVLPDSKEEQQISQLISQGVAPDQAAWAIMGPKREASAKSQKQVKQQKKVKQKAQANLETQGIPQNNGLPNKAQPSFREDLDAQFKAAGL